MKDDDVISEIRKVRHRISKANGHDPQRVVNYYMELQQQYAQFAQGYDNQAESVLTLRSQDLNSPQTSACLEETQSLPASTNLS